MNLKLNKKENLQIFATKVAQAKPNGSMLLRP